MPERGLETKQLNWRPAWAEVDLDAIAHNARLLTGVVAPAELCAVVKADGYGHGAVASATAALAGGATWLAVALVEEGVVLRDAGVTAPILLLSEPPVAAMSVALATGLTPTVDSTVGVIAAGAAVKARGPGHPPMAVHVKLDTGMHRVGADPAQLAALVRAVVADPGLELDGLWTHLAVADDADQDAFTAAQTAAFCGAVNELAAVGVRPRRLHVANSAGALAHAEARFDMVRCGLALYGYDPRRPRPATPVGLRPALSLRARVSHVRRLVAGEAVSYGRRYCLPVDAIIATVPLGYADGVPRRLFETGGQVLLDGRRRPIAGAITMDQLMVDCGPDVEVAVGDEVVLLGRQGEETITAEEWAERLDTIAYEIVCAISTRVPRRYHQSAASATRLSGSDADDASISSKTA